MTQQTHAQVKANKRADALKENLKKRKALTKDRLVKDKQEKSNAQP